MDSTGFYAEGALRHVAINLFYGWGYNFYRKENQLRADDQLVRAKAAWLLGQAHGSLDTAEHAYRREKLPPPSRTKPFPDPEAVAGCQALERMSAEVGAIVARLHALPAPENDRMTQRYRNEAETLVKLGSVDEQLVGQCELLRQSVDGQAGAWVLENLPSLEAGVAAINETVRQRQAVLT
ncbi:MAG TPA: hypothetical protein VHW60_11650 [Caulobacteraceae bacterium]|nr:hypothetical protein [Caulobacteraceae bacterium]